MRFDYLIYDTKTVLGSVGYDSRVDEEDLIGIINRTRAQLITQEYAITNFINPAWVQYLYKISLTKIDVHDDADVINGLVKVGKGTFPRALNIKDGVGCLSVWSSSRQERFYKTTLDKLMMMVELNDERIHRYKFYYTYGVDLFVYPFVSEASGAFILENPLEGHTTKQLLDDDGNIISAAGTKRNLTIKDDYPVDEAMARQIILEILTKEFNIEMKAMPDIINDSQDQLKFLKNAQVQG